MLSYIFKMPAWYAIIFLNDHIHYPLVCPPVNLQRSWMEIDASLHKKIKTLHINTRKKLLCNPLWWKKLDALILNVWCETIRHVILFCRGGGAHGKWQLQCQRPLPRTACILSVKLTRILLEKSMQGKEFVQYP